MIKRNHNYKLKAKPINPNVKLKEFEEHFDDIKDGYNSHKVRHPKEIDSIKRSDTEGEENIILIDLWTEDPLPAGRELQSVRRVSEALAGYDKTIVVPKSHVLVSA